MISQAQIALLVSTIGGVFVTLIWSEGWYWYLRRTFPSQGRDGSRALAMTIGLLERALITSIVIYLPVALGPLAGAWIVVKAAGGWGSVRSDERASRSRYYVTLLGSLMSISWATACGIWAMPIKI